jgi:hypothetical protein
LLFPEPRQDIQYAEDLVLLPHQQGVGAALKQIWERPIRKQDALGIHGTLFYQLERYKAWYREKREDAVEPLAVNKAQRRLFGIVDPPVSIVGKGDTRGGSNTMRILFGLLTAFSALTGSMITTGTVRAEEPELARPRHPMEIKRISSMSEDRFWALIETTKAFESNPERQLASLHEALGKLSPDEIEAYEAAFDDQMTRSYSWDLWGAAYVVHGGASDDGFEYFRCWLVSKGRKVFEKVMADPDSLADMLAPKVEGALQFEEFAYVARRVWGENTGRPSGEMPNAANMIYPGREPSGTRFDEDADHLAKRYPKLWRRFGTNPLD